MMNQMRLAYSCRWICEVLNLFESVDKSSAPAIAMFLCDALSIAEKNKSQLNIRIVCDIVGMIRKLLCEHSLLTSVSANSNWDVTCARVVAQMLFPGSVSSGLSRRVLELVSSDLNDTVPYDGSNGIFSQLHLDCFECIQACAANSVFTLRRKLHSHSLITNLILLRDDIGWTLLHHASYHSCIDVIRCLISEGLSPNEADYSGKTALHVAASCVHVDAVSILLQTGATASINVQDGNGATPLMCLLRSVQLSPWRLRISPGQLTDCIMSLAPRIDGWILQRAVNRVQILNTDDKFLNDIYSPSLFFSLLSIDDMTLSSAVILQLTKYIRSILPEHVANIPFEKAVQNIIHQQELSPSSEDAPGNQKGINTVFDILLSARSQIKLAVALAIRKKRVRLLQLLMSSLGSAFDVFNLVLSTGNNYDSFEVSSHKNTTEIDTKILTFYFRCLELSITTGSLRTVIVLIDLGSSLFGRLTCTRPPSCFVSLAVVRGDPLLLRLILERLGSKMDF
jgi:hypothetical protein